MFSRSNLRQSLLYAFGIALVSTAGCKRPEYPACKKDKHCNQEEDERCVDGVCQNCTTDEDCLAKGPTGENWVCHEFRCTDPTTIPSVAGDGEQGAPCAATAECVAGLVCRAGICDVCMTDGECAPGACNLDSGRCETVAAGGQCTTDDQCAMDEICDNGVCLLSNLQAGANPCSLDAIYFAFDSPKLDPKAQGELQTAAECINQQNRVVYLEAHADPRGTVEYNILLTDKRGQSVKKFLENLGVVGQNMQVISKGSLEATGSDEGSWSRDRRVQFIWQ
ncbi:MAG: OmpA family protein [Nannocystaceae bacterium]